jgi:hypothetical protein
MAICMKKIDGRLNYMVARRLLYPLCAYYIATEHMLILDSPYTHTQILTSLVSNYFFGISIEHPWLSFLFHQATMSLVISFSSTCFFFFLIASCSLFFFPATIAFFFASHISVVMSSNISCNIILFYSEPCSSWKKVHES